MDTSENNTAGAELEVDSVSPMPSVPAEYTTNDGSVEFNWLSLLCYKLRVSTAQDLPEHFFSIEQKPLNVDERDFLEELSLESKDIVANINSNAQYSSPMSLKLHLSRDLLTLYGCIFPSIGAGWRLNAEQLKKQVKEAGYVFGLIDNTFESVLSGKYFFRIFVIARGTPAQDGKDGDIIDLFSREPKINIDSDSEAAVDYKNLNWLQTIREGDVICKLVRPIPAVDGMDVRGLVVKGVTGKMPKIPAGNNTTVTEDGLSLVATSDGQLSYKGNFFRVDKMLNIDGSVDTAVGNLDVIGSISIKENVSEGFSIIATGDIIVRGIVEGAYLKAGGNIQIFHGMNGNSKGRLEAGGTVSSKYLENCYVTAKGSIKCGSIINSTVISSDIVSVTLNKGTIIGSDVTGFKGIEARVIGNDHNRLTTLTVGSNPLLLEELNSVRKQVIELERYLEENEKNIAYLDKSTALDEKYKQLLSKLKLDQSVNSMKLTKKKQRLLEINDELSCSDGQITATELFPPANVTMGKLKLSVMEHYAMCRVYNSDGQILIGKK